MGTDPYLVFGLRLGSQLFTLLGYFCIQYFNLVKNEVKMEMSVALAIQHAMRMRHIVICGLFRLYNIFPNYLINGHDFRKIVLNKKYVF